MKPTNIESELDALLHDTIAGLRKRITSSDANASDYSAAIKLLDATGTIDGLRDGKARAERLQDFAEVIDDLPSFDETGHPIQ